MSHPPSVPDPDDHERVGGRPTPGVRRRGKLIPAAVIALFVVLMVVLLSVTMCGRSADGVDGQAGSAAAGAGTAVVGAAGGEWPLP